MFSAAEKTVKLAPAVQQKAAGNCFFKKTGEEGFFQNKQTALPENTAFFNAPVQAKLKVSSPDDPQEKEADAVADRVMRMPEPTAEPKITEPITDKKEENISRKEAAAPKKDDSMADTVLTKKDSTHKLQTKLSWTIFRGVDASHSLDAADQSKVSTEENSARKNTVLGGSEGVPRSGRETIHDASSFEQSLAATKGKGSALSGSTRKFMESRFNADFSNVRIHTDTNAVNLSTRVQAQAFAHGNDIYFNSNKYAPDSNVGRSLLAHELTHTIQQGASKTKPAAVNSPESLAPKNDSNLNTDAVRFLPDQATTYTKATEIKPIVVQEDTEVSRKNNSEFSGHKLSLAHDQSAKAPRSTWQVGVKGHLQRVPVNPALPNSAEPEIQKKEDFPEKDKLAEQPKLGIQKKTFASANPAPHSAGIFPVKVTAGAPGLQLKAITAPTADPAFQAVVGKIKKTGQQAKKHEPAGKKVKEAQLAAKPPANEKESLAKDKKVAEMAQQEPGVFDEGKFKAALREKIAALQLNTLKDAENFKANNGAAAVKGDVSSQVNSEKEKAAGSIEGKVKEAPAPGSVPGKEVGPEPAPAPGVAAPTINGAQAAPKPVPATDVSLQKESQSLDKQMADAKVTEKQLSKSNEPSFTGALADKKTAQKDALERPQQFRKDEKGIIVNAQVTAAAVSKTQLNGLVGTQKQKMGGVLSKQQEAKAKDEADRAKVAADIEQKFNATKTEVEGILSKLDTDVTAMFDKGISEATQDFEDYVDREVRKYKIDRYLNRIGGSLLWAADLLLGLPDEVNDIYKRGKERYVRSMDVVINKVARLVVTQLNAAKKRIATGKAEIKSYVDKLPKNLQAIGNDAAKKVQAQFSELEQGVNNKQNELVDTLAAKYKAGLENVDKKIAEMKEANKGLVDKAIGAIKDVIDAIIEFKNMLLNVLARAAAAIDLIIEDPIGFLGNLVAGVKQGIQKFVGNIATHLKNGLMGWLFGTLAEAGIQMPQSFDAKGIMSLILQVLGLTYANIRARAVNIVGEKVVAGLEKAAEIFIILKNEGIGGLWRFIKEKVEQLKDTVIESIKSFVIEKIVVAGVTWLVSMLNPASAFIKACKMIYDVIMFFVTRGSQIMALVNAVIDSVTAIAKGAIGVAATAVENALAKALPVAISFLASLLGLGGISEKIKAIIAKIQAPINAAIDWVINKAVALVKAAGKLLMAGGKKVVGAIKSLLGIKKSFSASDGTSHSLFFKGNESNPELMVATTAMPVRDALKQIALKIKDPGNEKLEPQYIKADKLVYKISKDIRQVQKKDQEGYQLEDIENVNSSLKELSDVMESLMPLLSDKSGAGAGAVKVGDLLKITRMNKYASVSDVSDMIRYKVLEQGNSRVSMEGFPKESFEEKVKNKEIVIELAGLSKKTRRDLYMGPTPDITGDVGRKVKERMKSLGKYDTAQKPGQFKDRGGEWFPIKVVNMGHVIDAAKWWNSNGRFKGPRAPEVISFMNDPDNYELEDKVQNQLRGATEGDRYLPPTS
ncbi:eCIS core domain-containing protein [Adhaeribacter pallidiroseus]|uniref:eCIS core domain-containing protein n=1 Tax=Adhaeribacter pallidiroseus TaxID=2072847 RepID=A0A369QED1_9BACT|nr:DUF4157 domain-containing protein [Adhaeribacter pallidiroseus]RDC62670.1 hypothetical protein AHMF7616_01264 [Adhaeribacter pallidiroseus]